MPKVKIKKGSGAVAHSHPNGLYNVPIDGKPQKISAFFQLIGIKPDILIALWQGFTHNFPDLSTQDVEQTYAYQGWLSQFKLEGGLAGDGIGVDLERSVNHIKGRIMS